MVGGVAALGLLAWGVASYLSPPPVARRITEVPTPTPEATPPSPVAATPTPTPRPSNQAAELTVDFEHSLKSGVLRIFVDDLKVVEEPFGGRITRKVVGVEMRKGRITETLEVTPGLRMVKVEVRWDDNVKTERSQTFFNPGGRLRLKAKLGSLGGLRKDLSLEWN